MEAPVLIGCLFALAAGCLAFGLAWPLLEAASPPSITVPVQQIATNPVAWFAVLMLGLTAAILLPKRRTSFDESKSIKMEAVAQLAVAEKPSEQKPSEGSFQEKIFIDVSPQYLVDLYKGRTSVQADAHGRHVFGEVDDCHN